MPILSGILDKVGTNSKHEIRNERVWSFEFGICFGFSAGGGSAFGGRISDLVFRIYAFMRFLISETRFATSTVSCAAVFRSRTITVPSNASRWP